MTFEQAMKELENSADAQSKRNFQNHGANENIFGVSVKSLRNLAKKINLDHDLAIKLYQSGNFDAMHLSAMIADPSKLSEADLNRMVEGAYCHVLSDYVVASLAAETEFTMALKLSGEWINSESIMERSCGWTTLSMLLTKYEDTCFDKALIMQFLNIVKNQIKSEDTYIKYSMNRFVEGVGISYMPLHEEALEIAKYIGTMKLHMSKATITTLNAYESILDAKRNKLGQKKVSFR